jgi:ACS family 4-hydroxyphenylacetate permease-like MFS transporter
MMDRPPDAGPAEGDQPSRRAAQLREVLTPAVLMYTLAYFCLTNTLSAINIWTPQILQSFNKAAAISPSACWRRSRSLYHSRDDLVEPPPDKHQERSTTALPFLFAAAGWLLASATDHSLIQLLGIMMASTGSFTAMAIFWTTPDRVISLRAARWRWR